MDQSFEIHAPGINAGEVIRKVEERVAALGLSADEIEHVARMTLAPAASASELVFNAAAAIERFERPVPPPDFSSSKYPGLRGPLRTLAREAYNIFARLHERMMQNRSLAFHSVVQGMSAIQRTQNALAIELRALAATPTDASRPATASESSSTVAAFDRGGAALLPAYQRECAALLQALSQAPAGVGLVVGPENPMMAAAIAKDLARPLQQIDSIAALRGQPAAFVLAFDAAQLADLPALAPVAHACLGAGGLLYCLFDNGPEDIPFARRSLWTPGDAAALREYFDRQGFVTLRLERPPGLREGSWAALFRLERR